MAQKEKEKKKWWQHIWFFNQFNWLLNALIFAKLDILNFLKFRKEIKAEQAMPDSLFNKYELKTNKLGNVIYMQTVITEEQAKYFDDLQKRNLLIDRSMPVHKYLCDPDGLNWGEYLTTEFIDFIAENGNVSRYYGITFTFKPYSINNKKLYFSLLFNLAWIAGLCWMVMPYAINLIKSVF